MYSACSISLIGFFNILPQLPDHPVHVGCFFHRVSYSPWLNPIEMLWRHFRREVTHCELFATKQALLAAARDFFDRYKQCPHKILSIIGSSAVEATHPAEVA
jgi:putative transposase